MAEHPDKLWQENMQGNPRLVEVEVKTIPACFDSCLCDRCRDVDTCPSAYDAYCRVFGACTAIDCDG